MKKAILFLLIMPLGMIGQNITNTLGSGGDFIVEDDGNNTLISANRNASIEVLTFGDFSTGFNLPPLNLGNTGNFMFIKDAGTLRLNIITSSVGGEPIIQMLTTPGSLTAPNPLVNNTILGTLKFGGYFGNSWRTDLAFVQAKVTGTPSGSANVPTTISFQTTSAAGASNSMTFDSDGNLTVPGNSINLGYVVSGAIQTVSSAYSITASSNDQTLLADGTFTIDVHDAGAIQTGKTYTIKNVGSGTITIEPDIAGQFFDGTGTNNSILLTNTGEYITIQTDASNWYVIGGNL